MIEYIKHVNLSTIIYQTNDELTINKPMLAYIKDLCHKQLFDYDGYKKAVKKQFGIKYKIPLYINSFTELIPLERIKNYDNIWINYAAISDIIKLNKGCEIIFTSGRAIMVKYSYHMVRKQIKRLEEIINYASKHFHV